MKLLIFDFDGTIADTKSLYYHAIYNNVKRFGYSYKDIDKVIDLGMNLRKTLRRLGLNPLMRVFMKRRITKHVIKDLNKVKKCRDVDSLNKLKQEKILVTNSFKTAVYPVLKHYKINCFKEIYGFEDFSDKGIFLKKYMKKRKLRKEDCYYIGDRAADVKTAKKAGCKSIIIIGKCSWDNQKEIIEQQPDFLVHSIKDLKEIVKI